MNQRLKLLRKKLGFTQTGFGTSLGKTMRTIQDYEAGKRTITGDILLKLNELYNVNISWLRTGEGEMFLKEALKAGFDSDKPLPREHTLVMHAVRHMSVEEAQDLLKYIEDKEAAKKYIEMLKKEQAG